MKDLKCGLKDCRFNKGYSCVAKNITVDKGTDCTSFEVDTERKTSLFEAASDFVPANYSVDTCVACRANCVFNRGDHCISNGITVMSDNDAEPTCLTFIKD